MKDDVVAGVSAYGVPFAQHGSGLHPLIIINGGQGFVRRSNPARVERDVKRTARMLPKGTTFVLIGYPADPPEGLTVARMVDDLASTIREHWHVPAMVLGISYGGLLASWLATRHPDLINRLVIVASGRGFSMEGKRRVRRQIDFAASGDFPGFVDDFAALFRRPWLNALVQLRIRLGRKRLAHDMADPTTIVRYLTAMLDAGPVPVELIQAPTLIVGGSDDQFFGDGVMEDTARTLPNARLVLLPNETHMAPVERAGDVARSIECFLADRRAVHSQEY